MEFLTLKTIISNGSDKKININDKGLTLLEVLITLAILSIVVVSFISIFTNTNLTINHSGKKTTAIMEGKSVLDKISLETKTFETINENTIENIISQILDQNNYKIFKEDNQEFNKYDKENNYKMHFLIQDQSIELKELESENSPNTIISNAIKTKVVVFYDYGKKKVELSNYIPTKEEINEK